jgi:threonine dehydratase
LAAVAIDFEQVKELRKTLRKWVVETPVLECVSLQQRSAAAQVFAKLEFLQGTGTFKLRGALAVMLGLSREQLKAGITAVSAGNHAIAAAFAARELGSSAKVVMMRSANPYRVSLCEQLGAEVLIADTVHNAFELAEDIRKNEGRYFVHPYEGLDRAMGTAIAGLEIDEQIEEFDTVIIPIGGGGLCAGIAAAIKHRRPDCEVIGVEPFGADTMFRSFASGKPEAIEKVTTIADSLGAPFALPVSFELCRANVDRIVRVHDDELRRAMGILYRDMNIAVEPACAATTAAMLGPLVRELKGRRPVLIMCGSNIDWQTFQNLANFGDSDVN